MPGVGWGLGVFWCDAFVEVCFWQCKIPLPKNKRVFGPEKGV